MTDVIQTVKLEEMFYYITKTFYDCMKEEIAEDGAGGYACGSFADIQTGILTRNRSKLAVAFADGFTPMMIPDFNEAIKELRIIDEDTNECIMVFTRSELSW